MSATFTLIVRFKVQETAKAKFINQLKELFGHIRREETFVEASLQQDRDDPTSLLAYEMWTETPESIVKNQLTREYRKGFEQAIMDLKVERTPLGTFPSPNGRRPNGSSCPFMAESRGIIVENRLHRSVRSRQCAQRDGISNDKSACVQLWG
jgi:quinol monooxygenase YgiN